MAAAGYHEFIIAAGYKQEVVKEYFHQFYTYTNDFTIEPATGQTTIRERELPDWTVSVIDTGLATMTGGRIKHLQPLIGNEPFMCTYGDGLAAIDIDALVRAHRSAGHACDVNRRRSPAGALRRTPTRW